MAVESLVELVSRSPIPQWASRMPEFQAFGSALARAGVRDDASLARIARSRLATSPHREFLDRFAAACAILGASVESPPQWNEIVAQSVLVPWMRKALGEHCYDNGLAIENMLYLVYVRAKETEEHFRKCLALWSDDMRQAGKSCAAAHPFPERKSTGALPRVGFFVHNVTPLAHAITLLEVLQGHAELDTPLMEPILFYLYGEPATLERFRAAGVRLEPLQGTNLAPGPCRALLHMRRRVAEEGVEAVAWISLAFMMPFAFALRVAPRQVWWAMKYHALELPEIDVYLTGGGEIGTHEIQGHLWQVGPVVAQRWFAPELSAEARRIRATLGSTRIVFGTFGREEKLDSFAFLDAIIEILRARPDAAFLWTGRTRLASIQKRFEDAGVAARCHFIGWVDTKLYAQVIDVFLDSFPFPCGFTLYEAMAAGKASVLFASTESSHGGIHAIAGPMLAAEARDIFQPGGSPSLYLRASSPAEYVDMALRLAEDESLRQRAGSANQQFIEKMMTDRRRAARIYVDYLLARQAA